MTNEELVLLIQQGIDKDANIEKLYLQTKNFFYTVAQLYAYNEDDIEDLVQEGYFGFIEAIDRYDPEEGANFITYLFIRLRSTMGRYCREKQTSVRLPGYLYSLVRKLQNAEKQFIQTVGREPTDKELSWLVGLKLGQLQSVKDASKLLTVMSLDEPLKASEDGSFTLGDTLNSGKDFEEELTDSIAKEELSHRLWSMVRELKPEQAQVIEEMYHNGLSGSEVGAKLNIPEKRVYTIHHNAIRQLRTPRRLRKLKEITFDLYSYSVHNRGVRAFENTWTSSTEAAAFKDMELQEWFNSLVQSKQ